ncbi:MAG: hypothetical protein R2862_04440 [Thermoanaerobaculia bacterium]
MARRASWYRSAPSTIEIERSRTISGDPAHDFAGGRSRIATLARSTVREVH